MKAFLTLLSLTSPFLVNLALADTPPSPTTRESSVHKNVKAAISHVPTKIITFNVIPATSEARHWLSILDENKFDEAWEKASLLVKESISKEAFIAQALRSREPLGSFIKRDILMAQPHTQFPGSPKGHYVLITFKSTFHNKDKVTETIMVQQEPDTTWRVAGYFIL